MMQHAHTAPQPTPFAVAPEELQITGREGVEDYFKSIEPFYEHKRFGIF